jgi:hypothetical protein
VVGAGWPGGGFRLPEGGQQYKRAMGMRLGQALETSCCTGELAELW